MKIVFLINSTPNTFERMVDLVENKNTFIVDTEQCDESHEYKYLTNSIKEFSHSKNEIMLGKFSGNDTVIQEIGDERPEMVVALSTNRDSRYYSEKPIDTFLDLIQMFEKETTILT